MEKYHYLNWRGNCATLFMPVIDLLCTASLITPRNAQCIRAAEVCRQSGIQMIWLLMKSICFLGTRSSAFESTETIRIEMRANSQTRCNVVNNLTTSSRCRRVPSDFHGAHWRHGRRAACVSEEDPNDEQARHRVGASEVVAVEEGAVNENFESTGR
jgi:hypothetical protein